MRFVLLELVDEEISGLINGIREILMPDGFRTSVHLTLRGPYGPGEKIEPEEISKWTELLKAGPIVLDGIGTFRNRDRYVIYIKVSHRNLRRVWWKPDFPVERYGYNPHITLYEGDNWILVDKVADFLKGEKLSLLTEKFRLAIYTSKQDDLFNLPDVSFRAPLDLVNRKKVSLTFFQRLERLVREYQDVRQTSWLDG